MVRTDCVGKGRHLPSPTSIKITKECRQLPDAPPPPITRLPFYLSPPLADSMLVHTRLQHLPIYCLSDNEENVFLAELQYHRKLDEKETESGHVFTLD